MKTNNKHLKPLMLCIMGVLTIIGIYVTYNYITANKISHMKFTRVNVEHEYQIATDIIRITNENNECSFLMVMPEHCGIVNGKVIDKSGKEAVIVYNEKFEKLHKMDIVKSKVVELNYKIKLEMIGEYKYKIELLDKVKQVDLCVMKI